MGVSALTTKSPLGSDLMKLSSSTSCSSSISPTICSSTSSMVTRPATPPYSSTTMAMWLWVERNSRSSTLSRLDSGTKVAGRSTALRSKVRSWSSSSGSRSLASSRPRTSSGPSPITG